MLDVTLFHYLSVSLILFVTGFLGSVMCKNVIKILISIEFMLTAVNINLSAFAKYCDGNEGTGFVFVLFYTGIGAVELAVALYIFYLMHLKKQTENIESYGDL